MKSFVEVLDSDSKRDNENSFYDVFDEYTSSEIEEYKLIVGIPISTTEE